MLRVTDIRAVLGEVSGMPRVSSSEVDYFLYSSMVWYIDPAKSMLPQKLF